MCAEHLPCTQHCGGQTASFTIAQKASLASCSKVHGLGALLFSCPSGCSSPSAVSSFASTVLSSALARSGPLLGALSPGTWKADPTSFQVCCKPHLLTNTHTNTSVIPLPAPNPTLSWILILQGFTHFYMIETLPPPNLFIYTSLQHRTMPDTRWPSVNICGMKKSINKQIHKPWR